MEPFVIDKNKLIIASLATESSLCAGISTRLAGNMALHVGAGSENAVRNRIRIADEIGIELGKWVCLNQTHATNIKKITSSHCGAGITKYADSLGDTDGIYTFAKNILLTIQVADCVPLYFYHAPSGGIGVVHAGWRGTAAKIAVRLVELWHDEGIPVSEVQVFIGPSICAQCFTVGTEVVDDFKNCLGKDAPLVYKAIGNNKYNLDVKLANKIILQKAGVRSEMIHQSKYCTRCDSDKFFSFRQTGEKAGRLLAYIGRV